MNVKIIGFQKTSFIDYPGTVSTVLFLSGCNLRCPYCHNPGIVLGEYEAIPFEDIRSHLVKRQGVIEGVVITGGEPTLHGGLRELCDEIRSLGMLVKIDTNGLEPDKVIDCAPDYLALDIKTAFENYSRVNIPQNIYDRRERLCRSIDFVKSMGDRAEVRITAAPGIVDIGDIEKLLHELRGVKKVFIQQFDPAAETLDPSFAQRKPYERYTLDGWQKMFKDAGIDCAVRAQSS